MKTRGRAQFALQTWLALLVPMVLAPAIAWAGFDLPRGQYGPEDPKGDLAEFLTAQQLVVRGRLRALVPVERTQIGGCGLGSRGPYESWDIEVAVDSVLFGSAEDTVITITTVGKYLYPPGVFTAGREVLAWAFHNCVDGWRLYGDALAVDTDGTLWNATPSQAPTLLKVAGGTPVRPKYDSLMNRLAALAGENGVRMLVGSEGVVSARVATVAPSALGLVCTIDSTEIVFGSGEAGPAQVTFAWRNGCFYDVRPGDWLLVPTGAQGAIVLQSCPYTIIVRDGFSRGLGVPLDQLEYVLTLGPNGVIVRSVLGD